MSISISQTDSVWVEEKSSTTELADVYDDRIEFSDRGGMIVCLPDGAVFINGVSSLALKKSQRAVAADTEFKSIAISTTDAIAENESRVATKSKIAQEKTSSSDSRGWRGWWIILIIASVLAFIIARYLTPKP